MINKEDVVAELQARVKISINLKRDMDIARTPTKKNYIRKKLTKNNLVASKLLVVLERIETIQRNKDATQTDADGSSQEES